MFLSMHSKIRYLPKEGFIELEKKYWMKSFILRCVDTGMDTGFCSGGGSGCSIFFIHMIFWNEKLFSKAYLPTSKV